MPEILTVLIVLALTWAAWKDRAQLEAAAGDEWAQLAAWVGV